MLQEHYVDIAEPNSDNIDILLIRSQRARARLKQRLIQREIAKLSFVVDQVTHDSPPELWQKALTTIAHESKSIYQKQLLEAVSKLVPSNNPTPSCLPKQKRERIRLIEA